MLRLVLPVVSLAACASFAAAQTLAGISPKTAIAAGPSNPGVSGLGYGFGVDAHRFQQIHNFDSFTTGTTPLSIRSMNFRMPLNYNTGNQGGQNVEVEVWLSYAASGIDASTATINFDGNRDPATTMRVFAKKNIQLPILGTPTNPSTGFDFKLPFDAGRLFLYLPSRSQALVMDLWNFTYKASTYTYYCDGWTRARSGIPGGPEVAMVYAAVPAATGFGISGPNGSYAGCPSSASKNVTHTMDGRTLVPCFAFHQFEGDCFVGGLPGVLILGANPLDATLPGTACKLVQDLILLEPFVSDSTGKALVTWTLPCLNLGGVTILTQMAWLDPRANSLGIVTSNGLTSTFGVGTGPSRPLLTAGRSLITEYSN